VGENADSEGGTCVVALQTEQSWGGRQSAEAAVGIALPYAGVPADCVCGIVGTQRRQQQNSLGILVASFKNPPPCSAGAAEREGPSEAMDFDISYM